MYLKFRGNACNCHAIIFSIGLYYRPTYRHFLAEVNENHFDFVFCIAGSKFNCFTWRHQDLER